MLEAEQALGSYGPRPGRSLARAGIVTRLRVAGCVFAEDEADLLFEAAGTDSELERWWLDASLACRWSRSSAGPSSVACGSSWNQVSSSRAAAVSSWSARRSRYRARAVAPAPLPAGSSWICAAAPGPLASPWPAPCARQICMPLDIDPSGRPLRYRQPPRPRRTCLPGRPLPAVAAALRAAWTC